MKYKNNKNIYYCIAFLFIIIIIIIYYWIEYDENYETSLKTRTIEKDGFMVLYNKNYSDKTVDFPSFELERDVMKHLPKDYVFLDYIYKINNVSLSTFHRDVTSSKNIYKTVYPTYTLIIYKYDGKLLSVCPGSNNTYPFVWSNIVNIEGLDGTCFLFDCDLLHSGCINNCKKRNVIQYKICHKNDLGKLQNLQRTRQTKTEVCKNNYYVYFLRKISYYLEFPINYLFTPLLIKREQNNLIGFIQSFIPINFYNNY